MSSNTLLWIVLVASVASGILAALQFFRSKQLVKVDSSALKEELRLARDETRASERAFREEVVGNLATTSENLRAMLETRITELRESNDKTIREVRHEHVEALRLNTESIEKSLSTSSSHQKLKLDEVAKELKEFGETNQRAADALRGTIDARIKELQESNEKRLEAMRLQAAEGTRASNEVVTKGIETLGTGQQLKLEAMTEQLKQLIEGNLNSLDRIRGVFDLRLKELQEGNEKKHDDMRLQAVEGRKSSDEVLSKGMETLGVAQQAKLDAMTAQLKELTEGNQNSLERIRAAFDARLKDLQEGNEKKLEEMRKTVDEKLHETLEKRLGESFKQVSERLESVHRGLGEMQTLASGVGDLKRVLTNVKARGTWAEVQLGALLEQVFTADQFSKNVPIKPNSLERVEFAVRLPGPKSEPGSIVWLPIDSKFPQEDYIRLQDAADKADIDAVAAAAEALARTVRSAAKDINDKYVDPPATTNFGIMFLATEGLYAEVLGQPALVDELQRKHRVVVAGPTTLVAILSSLRMGFQTLAIEQRASEVWRVLGTVKSEFGKFGDTLDKVKRQLASASKTIDDTGVRTRAIQRQLRTVEQLESSIADLDTPLVALGVLPIGGDDEPVTVAISDEDLVEGIE